MAPERTARPGGLGLPGMRNSALASAALTSVALLSQTGNAAPAEGDEAPSREEVRQRVSSLYDRAESDTGTFNATRAAATRSRTARPDERRGRTARPDDGRRRSDPAVDNVARQWFDVARSRLGPTVPAVLPPDRRPARPAERAGDGRAGGGRETADRARPELTSAPVAELTSGPAPVAELTAAPVPALPAAPETPQPETWPEAAQTQDQFETQAFALPAPATEQWQSSPQSAPLAAVETPPVEDTWSTTGIQTFPDVQPEWQQQQPAGLGTVAPATADWTTTAGQAIDTGTGTLPVAAQDTSAVRAVAFARAQIGKPSLWGATGPDSYDAGGLVQAAWKAAGVALPRTPPEQATAGTPDSLLYVEPGDLVLFHVGHVGISTGNGMMIHAPGPGTCIREVPLCYAGEEAIHSVIRPA